MAADRRLCQIKIENAHNVQRHPIVEQEINAAIDALLAENVFDPVTVVDDGPYRATVTIVDGRLLFLISDSGGRELNIVSLSARALQNSVRDYFMICESYMTAAGEGSSLQMETIDMARRALHDEGSVQLAALLHGKIIIDFATARRLFTLVSALHIGSRNEVLPRHA
jgi:uncharacterized protein (UPF0262 family)